MCNMMRGPRACDEYKVLLFWIGDQINNSGAFQRIRTSSGLVVTVSGLTVIVGPDEVPETRWSFFSLSRTQNKKTLYLSQTCGSLGHTWRCQCGGGQVQPIPPPPCWMSE